MFSVTFRYFGTFLVILSSTQYLHFTLSYVPNQICKETVLAPLTPASHNCSHRESFNGYGITLTCTKTYRSKRGFLWKQEMLLEVPNSDFGSDWQCVSILVWSGKTDRLENLYAFEFITPWTRSYIGILKRSCKHNGRNCSLEVKLREDVLALPPFSFTPDEPEFWNFSSPLFRAEFGWLWAVNLTGSLPYHYPFVLPGLSGSSIGKIFVNGSFGTDQRGTLPHLDNLPLLRTLTIINSTMDLLQENFTNTMNIRNLKLLKNKFEKIPKFIGEMRDLVKVTFESTMKNFSLSTEALNGLEHLTYLSLSGSLIEQCTMSDFPVVSELRLNRCKMRKISAVKHRFNHQGSQDFRLKSGLVELYLSENLLSSLSASVFIDVPFLRILDLSYNSFIQLPSKILLPLRDLSEVFLKGNKINSWPMFSYNSYNVIDLSQNLIKNVINLGNQVYIVSYLDLSNNRISGWDNTNIFTTETREEKPQIAAFSNPSPWVFRVNLSHNSITEFSPAMLASLSVLKEVDLGGNMVNCGECKTSLLQQWLVNPKPRVKNVGQSTPLTCYQPPELKGRPIQDVNFAEVCFIPRRYLWLGIGAPIAGVIAFIAIGGAIFYYRTEVVYLAHLAKIRAKATRKTQTETNACFDAFVCYSGKNRKWVNRRLVPLMERRPEYYSLCLFDRDFRLGTHIVTNIVDAIEHSRKVIVVLTQHFIDSKWCQWELEMAQHKLFSEDREFLVLLELEPLERRRLPRLLRFLLDTRPVVRWPRPETAPAVKAAAAELRRALGPSLRQNLFVDTPTGNEPRPTTSAADVQESLLTDEHTQGN